MKPLCDSMAWIERLDEIKRRYSIEPTAAPADAAVLRIEATDPDRTAALLQGVRELRALTLDRPTKTALAVLPLVAPQLEMLVLSQPAVVDLRGIGPAGLRALEIIDATKLESLVGIEALVCLEALVLDNFTRVRNLEPLREVGTLQELALRALMSRTSPHLVDSFEPLGALEKLEILDFDNVVSRDRDLLVLRSLRALRRVRVPNYYPVEHVAALAASAPHASGFGLSSHEVIEDWQPCDRCGSSRAAQLFGRRRDRFVCLRCDADVVMRHRGDFEAFRQKYLEHDNESEAHGDCLS